MKPINIEVLLNHSTGISDAYYRATENELLEDYLKAVDVLTINADKSRLQKQIEELKQESKDKEYVMKDRLQEKEKLLIKRDSMIAGMTSAADVVTQLEQKGNRINELEQQMTQMNRRLEWIFRKMQANNIDEQDEGGYAMAELGDEILGKAG